MNIILPFVCFLKSDTVYIIYVFTTSIKTLMPPRVNVFTYKNRWSPSYQQPSFAQVKILATYLKRYKRFLIWSKLKHNSDYIAKLTRQNNKDSTVDASIKSITQFIHKSDVIYKTHVYFLYLYTCLLRSLSVWLLCSGVTASNLPFTSWWQWGYVLFIFRSWINKTRIDHWHAQVVFVVQRFVKAGQLYSGSVH